MEYGSKLLEKAVDHIAQLPGIGKRTALRLALHLLQRMSTWSEMQARFFALRPNGTAPVGYHALPWTDAPSGNLEPLFKPF